MEHEWRKSIPLTSGGNKAPHEAGARALSSAPVCAAPSVEASAACLTCCSGSLTNSTTSSHRRRHCEETRGGGKRNQELAPRSACVAAVRDAVQLVRATRDDASN